MNRPIFVAGHRGLVGSAIVRRLQAEGLGPIVTRSREELDLRDMAATDSFFFETRPRHVYLAAARVGGIVANASLPADFIYDNLAIQTSVIQASYRWGVERLLFLGSSCIYPKFAPQPMPESSLLTGPLEPTNRAYALAKIAGIEMCWSYNRQHGTRYLAVMPTNLYGPGDSYDLTTSHVIPALLRKFHDARTRGARSVTVWGSGTPRREFLHSDDAAKACVHLMRLDDAAFGPLLGSDEAVTGRFEPPIVNIGCSSDLTIAELAEFVRDATDFAGHIEYDRSKPDGPPRKLLDATRLLGTGWTPTIGFREGLSSAYADFRAHFNATEGQPA
jgi:GDP-L-fucose synthase